MEINATDPTVIRHLLEKALQFPELIQSLKLDVIGEDAFDLPLEDLLKRKDWPYAVPPDMITDLNSEEDKRLRASAIADKYFPNPNSLRGITVLDFGCGDGYLVAELTRRGCKKAVGYDIVRNASWDNNPSETLTTEWDTVTKFSSYDYIIAFDVIDHLIGVDNIIERIQKELSNIISVLRHDGRFFVRCHPYTSRHGTHLYRADNRAFLHLFLSDKELEDRGLIGLPTIKLRGPMWGHYSYHFHKSNLLVINSFFEYDEIEPFFSGTPSLKKALTAMDCLNNSTNNPYPIMRVSHIDYELTKK